MSCSQPVVLLRELLSLNAIVPRGKVFLTNLGYVFFAQIPQDAEFLLQLDPPIEYICVSFVQKGQDLQDFQPQIVKLFSLEDFSGHNMATDAAYFVVTNNYI